MKKTKLGVIVLLIVTLLMCPIYATAETPEGITEIVYPEVYLDDVDESMMPRTVSSAVITFSRESSTVGSGYASAYTTTTADYIKVTVTLQQAASGSSTYSNSSQDPVTRTLYDTDYIRKAYSFNVTTTKNYRVKVVIKDKTNGVISTKTLYKKLS